MDKKRVFIAGHRGMVGSAIVRQLENRNDIELIIRIVLNLTSCLNPLCKNFCY